MWRVQHAQRAVQEYLLTLPGFVPKAHLKRSVVELLGGAVADVGGHARAVVFLRIENVVLEGWA